jgi:hypothetical protein
LRSVIKIFLIPNHHACRRVFVKTSERYYIDSTIFKLYIFTNKSFSIGIVGGFAPPTPNAIYTITQPLNKTELLIRSATRTDGTPGLQDAVPKSISSDDDHTASLVDELHRILMAIPTEEPQGSEDIYGLDTSIAWFSNDLEWINGGPQGCSGGVSTVQPTQEDKAKFKRAIDIVHELVQKDK